MDLTLQQSIIVALISAIFSASFTLLIRWLLSNFGRTKYYAYISNFSQKTKIEIRFKAIHTKKKKYFISNVTIIGHSKNKIIEFIGSDEVYYEKVTNESFPRKFVIPQKYSFILTDDYILDEVLYYHSKCEFDLHNIDLYLVINNKAFYKIDINSYWDKFQLLKKISDKERKILNGSYGKGITRYNKTKYRKIKKIVPKHSD